MSIRIIPYRGGFRPYWYAEYKENGKTHQIRLSEKIAGVPPKSLSIKDEGSVLYEKSKARALAEFEAFENERKRKGTSERLMEELIASKTGTVCDIPLFDEFRKVCETIITSSDPSEPYLFPEAVAMYDTNRTGLCDRGKRLFAKALFKDIGEKPKVTIVVDGKPKEPMSAVEVYALIDKQGYKPPKGDRMKSVYDMYIVQGKSYRQIENELGIPRSSITDYMQAIEKLTGDTLIRFDAKHGHIVDKLDMTRKHREGAKRAVSIYGWASLRSTFCRLAIERGVDEKMIMRAAGHSNFKTTLTYYDNPTRTHQREMMKAKMAATAIGHSSSTTPLATSIMRMVDRLPKDQQMLLAENLKALLKSDTNGPKQLAASA